MIRSVLVPADFSAEDELVLEFAEGLTVLGAKRVVVGHVVDTSGMEGPVIAAEVDRARDRLRGFVGRVRPAGAEVELRVGTGDPAEGLLALAAESHVDLIAAGSSGKTRVSRLLAGSVSEELLTLAERPTMLARYDLLRNAESPVRLAERFGHTLLLPVDFSGSSMRAFMTALEFPRGAVQTLYLMHVLDPDEPPERAARAEEGAAFQMDNMCRMAEEKGIVARTVIRRGDVKQLVLREIDERRATGVVTGRHGRTTLGQAVLGSVSMTLMRQASCPVLIVP